MALLAHNGAMFYLSDESNMQRACELTELEPDEIEMIVGRFAAHSHRAGQLRGKVVETKKGVAIKTSFGNKHLWP